MLSMIVCSWCNTVIREGSHPISHGICLSCSEAVLPAEERFEIGMLVRELPYGLIYRVDGFWRGYVRVEHLEHGTTHHVPPHKLELARGDRPLMAEPPTG